MICLGPGKTPEVPKLHLHMTSMLPVRKECTLRQTPAAWLRVDAAAHYTHRAAAAQETCWPWVLKEAFVQSLPG